MFRKQALIKICIKEYTFKSIILKAPSYRNDYIIDIVSQFYEKSMSCEVAALPFQVHANFGSWSIHFGFTRIVKSYAYTKLFCNFD